MKTVHYRDLGTVIMAQLHDIVFIYVYRQFDLVRSVNQNLVFGYFQTTIDDIFAQCVFIWVNVNFTDFRSDTWP